MVSEEVRPRMTGKGTNQETVTRKKRILSMKEKQKGDPWEMGGAVRTSGEDVTGRLCVSLAHLPPPR